MPTKNPIYAFVDIETTGSRANFDRITEVGIVTLENQEVSQWSGLINPGVSIPNNIQQLTGITPAMVSAKLSFAEIAEELYLELKDKIFVAHNARFDYSFLKAEFKRLGIDFSPKVICTVKLSRRLFPNQARHNLDTLIAVHGLQVKNRHQALDDAKLLYQFWQCCEATFDQEHFHTQIDYLLGRPSLPPHIDRELIDEIPNRPGVYLFYAENKQPLYIGKSNDLRAQIRNWMGIWFFLQERHGETIERFDDRMVAERRNCIGMLDTYFRMRKLQDEHALMAHRRLQITPPNTFENIVLPHEIPRVVIGANEMADSADESSTS